MDWLWSSRPWSRPWQEQYTLGEELPLEDDGAPARVVHLADEATVTVALDEPPARPEAPA